MAGAFSALQTIVDTTLNGVKSPEISNIVDSIGSIFGSIMLLWVTYKSIDVAMGYKRFVITENLHRILMIAIITAIAFDTSGWINIILRSIKEFKAIAITGGGAIAQLDTITDEFNQATIPIIENSPWGCGWLIALIFWASYFLMVCSSLFVLLGSEIILAMALLFTPLAILCLAFEPTRKCFDGWLSSVVGSIILMILARIVMSIISSVTSTIVDTLGNTVSASFIASGTTAMFAFFFFYFMSDVKTLAKSLTGFTCGGITKAIDMFK